MKNCKITEIFENTSPSQKISISKKTRSIFGLFVVLSRTKHFHWKVSASIHLNQLMNGSVQYKRPLCTSGRIQSSYFTQRIEFNQTHTVLSKVKSVIMVRDVEKGGWEETNQKVRPNVANTRKKSKINPSLQICISSTKKET